MCTACAGCVYLMLEAGHAADMHSLMLHWHVPASQKVENLRVCGTGSAPSDGKCPCGTAAASGAGRAQILTVNMSGSVHLSHDLPVQMTILSCETTRLPICADAYNPCLHVRTHINSSVASICQPVLFDLHCRLPSALSLHQKTSKFYASDLDCICKIT